MTGTAAPPLALYVHWPFCRAKCPYCDFNSHVAQHIDQNRWRAAYLSELDRVAAETDGRVLHSVFFGGGTPSMMQPDLVGAILERVRRNWRLANDLEITLEANPTSVEAGRFRGYREAGVNRVSIGVQALSDEALRRLGRLHSVKEALGAIETARREFDRVSFDLIYARQDQSLADWRKELSRALEITGDHLSLYQLTIEEGTAFGARHAAGRLAGLPEEDLAADMFELTQDLCSGAGLPAYEISNHARPGAESRHNLIYWRYGDYLGVGPGAHGRVTTSGGRFATETHRTPGAWLAAVEQRGNAESTRQALSGVTQAEEMAMMGLRLPEGISLDRFRQLAGYDISNNNIKGLRDIDLVVVDDGRLRTTARGRPLLNAVLQKLLVD